MPRFFVDPPVGDLVLIQGEDARHIARSLRMREGQALTLSDGAGFDYDGEIQAVAEDQVAVQILAKSPNQSEPKVFVRLYQALPKGDKLETIVQKAVELGVGEIVPVLTDRCVSRPDSKAMAKKIQRLQKIALEAAKQSGRGRAPRILPLESFRQAVDGMISLPRAILLYEEAAFPFSRRLEEGAGDIALMVGSEGGFSPEEAAWAESRGVLWASLGRRILRCETAPLCALSAVLYACGEL